MEKNKYTVLFYPGFGITLIPYEIETEEVVSEEVLKMAAVKIIKQEEDHHILLKCNSEEEREIIEFYKDEFEEEKAQKARKGEEFYESDFLMEYLNMIYLDLSEYNLENYYIKYTEHLKIEKGWKSEGGKNAK